MSKIKPTLKVNIRAQEERQRSQINLNLGPQPKPRKGKGLNFHEPGTFVSQADKLRKRAKLEELQKKIAEVSEKAGISDAVKLASLASAKPENDKEEVPEVEWWDKQLLRNKPLDEVILKLDSEQDVFDGITSLIEHPQIKKTTKTDVSMPIFLTKDERKKLRRQNRRNAELEKQEKIKLGLLPQPEPKLKRSNIMYALGNETIIEPSKSDLMVREQQDLRLQTHLQNNESKKLTAEEKKAKKLRKIKEDTSVTGVHVSVFKIGDPNCKSYAFKISQNVIQLTMTGILVLNKDVNLIVVEGGPKQQRKFKHLVLDRMQWDCSLVWEGQVKQRCFQGFISKRFNSEKDARIFFEKKHIQHYWDVAVNTSILESID